MSDVDLRRRHGSYGLDGDFRLIPAVGQVVILGGIIAVAIVVTIVNIIAGRAVVAVISGMIAMCLVLASLCYAYTTRIGKFQVWARILTQLGLRGDENLLDLGCGRGAVLLAAAQLLPTGRAVGVDVWRAVDQTG